MGVLRVKTEDGFVAVGGGGGGASVELDTTLTKSGKAADAKAVGDALGRYITDIDAILGGDA